MISKNSRMRLKNRRKHPPLFFYLKNIKSFSGFFEAHAEDETPVVLMRTI